jgi:hypothetical protein
MISSVAAWLGRIYPPRVQDVTEMADLAASVVTSGDQGKST